MRKIIIIISFLFLVSKSSTGKIVYLNWFWGVEKINQQDFFTIDFMPKFEFKNFSFQLEFPVEVNSNWKARKNDWDGYEDIPTKIKYIQYQHRYFKINIKSLENISFQNKQLIYNYSNRLFETTIKKRGFLGETKLMPFSAKFMIDDIIDLDIFAGSVEYEINHINTGLGIFYDIDVDDPFSDKPQDSTGVKNLFVDFNGNYRLNIKRIKIDMENDFIKNLSSNADPKNYIFITGPFLQFYYLGVKAKLIYYNNTSELKIPVNHFYEIERNTDSVNSLSKLGYLFICECNIEKFIIIEFSIEKSESNPAYTYIGLSTGDNFFTAFYTKIKFYNRNVSKWYQTFQERVADTHLKMEFIFPLSEHLNFGFSYTKSFAYKEGSKLSPLRISMLKSEFRF